jgi:MSHA biogenesis protein MshP
VSLVAALFIIVVLAMLALFAVRVGAAGEQDITAQLMQDRAMAAARSGIEYGAYRAVVMGSCNAPAGAAFNVPLTEGALVGFTATVTCIRLTHAHNGGTYYTYEISSTARRGAYGTADYVSRALTRTLATAPP